MIALRADQLEEKTTTLPGTGLLGPDNGALPGGGDCSLFPLK